MVWERRACVLRHAMQNSFGLYECPPSSRVSDASRGAIADPPTSTVYQVLQVYRVKNNCCVCVYVFRLGSRVQRRTSGVSAGFGLRPEQQRGGRRWHRDDGVGGLVRLRLGRVQASRKVSILHQIISTDIILYCCMISGTIIDMRIKIHPRRCVLVAQMQTLLCGIMGLKRIASIACTRYCS